MKKALIISLLFKTVFSPLRLTLQKIEFASWVKWVEHPHFINKTNNCNISVAIEEREITFLNYNYNHNHCNASNVAQTIFESLTEPSLETVEIQTAEIINSELNRAMSIMQEVPKDLYDHTRIDFQNYPCLDESCSKMTGKENHIFSKLLPMIIFLNECNIKFMSNNLETNSKQSDSFIEQRNKIVNEVKKIFLTASDSCESDSS